MFCSEEHIAHFDRILCHKAIRSEWENKLSIKISTYEDFLANKFEDHYDFVLVVFTKDVGVDELEAQEDHYMYYAQVPVVHYAISDTVKNSDKKNEFMSFIKDHLEQRLVSTDPCELSDDINEATKSLS